MTSRRQTAKLDTHRKAIALSRRPAAPPHRRRQVQPVGAILDVTQTLTLAQHAGIPGGPLAASRYRR